MKKCLIKECKKTSVCKGYCGTHYTRLRRHGDPMIVKNIWYSENDKCLIADCKNKPKNKFLCDKHYARKLRYNDPNFVTSKDEWLIRCRESQPMLGVVKKNTYKKYFGRHLHRVEAEKKIGRKLLKGEIVHHIDGDKHNNSHSNLEVMTQADHARIHFSKKI
jgi:hypothetical protein